MTWKDYIANLSPLQRDIILYNLLKHELDDKGTLSDIRFTEGEDPNYQGTYTVNADIYWATTGDSLLFPQGDIS